MEQLFMTIQFVEAVQGLNRHQVHDLRFSSGCSILDQ